MYLKRSLVAISIVLSFLIYVWLLLWHSEKPLDIYWDNAMYIQAAQLILKGGTFDVDFIDTNPPLIVYICTVPEMLSRHFNVHVILVYKLFVLGVALLGSLLSYLLLWNRLNSEKHCSYLASMLVAMAAYNVLTFGDFGQREHIFSVLFLPFLFTRWLRWENERINPALALISGVLAALGLCLKPYFLLAPLLLELYWLATKRKWRPLCSIEMATCVVFGFAYAGSILFWPVAMRNNFLTEIARMHLLQDAVGKPFLKVLTIASFRVLFLAMLCALTLAVAFRNNSSLLLPMALFTVAGWMSFVIQCRDWTYHRLIAIAGTTLLSTLELVPIISTALKPVMVCVKVFFRECKEYLNPAVDIVLLMLAVASCNNLCGLIWHHQTALAYGLSTQRSIAGSGNLSREWDRLAANDDLHKVLATYSVEGDHVLILNNNVPPAFPALVQFNEWSASRYVWTYPLAEFEAGKLKARRANDSAKLREYQKAEHQTLLDLLADVRKTDPKLIIVFNDKQFYCPPDFSFYKVLNENGVASKLFEGYTLDDRTYQCSDGKFSLYRRQDSLEKGSTRESSFLKQSGNGSQPLLG